MEADMKAASASFNKSLTAAVSPLKAELEKTGAAISKSLGLPTPPSSFNTAAAGLASAIPKPPGG